MEGFPPGEILTLLAREIRAMPSAVRLREDYSAEEPSAPIALPRLLHFAYRAFVVARAALETATRAVLGPDKRRAPHICRSVCVMCS
jgi:hypothetical protein